MGAIRGLYRRARPENGRLIRLVLDQDGDTTPRYPPLYVLPSSAPSATGVKGDVYVDSTTGALMVHNGTSYQHAGGSTELTPGTGISTGSGTIYESSVVRGPGLITTTIFIDLTGLNSGGTAGDVIGKDATANCHIGQITAAVNGSIVGGRMTCLELVATGEPNIDLYSADEATLSEDAAISTATNEVALLESSGDWIATGALTVQGLKGLPVANQYLYLVAGDATSATYTAGQFLIELFGVPA